MAAERADAQDVGGAVSSGVRYCDLCTVVAVHVRGDFAFCSECDARMRHLFRADNCNEAVRTLLHYVGEDPDREGLRDTPSRVVKMLGELAAFNHEAAEQAASVHLDKTFAAPADNPADNDIVKLSGIRFASLCEHHLLPFVGTATVAYLPVRRVVGLSKLARVVKVFSRRLQLQERLTHDIAGAIEKHLSPHVAVLVRAHHSCMGCRGVEQPDAVMVTSCVRGLFRDNEAARAEVFAA